MRAVKAEPIFYEDGKDWRIVDLRPHGVDCIPLFAFGNFAAMRPGAEPHVHPGCIEVSLCMRGNVVYEADGVEYPVLPGHVFISRPNEPHRRRDNPKGMSLYRMLFRLPSPRGRILGLLPSESAFVARTLLHLPCRLFHATTRLRRAFRRLMELYDARSAPAHRLEMKSAALELLLALVEAPDSPHVPRGATAAKVRAIVRRIALDPAVACPVASLAKEVGLSSFAFTEVFKRMTGLTPHAYLIDQRIRRAREDLLRGGTSVAHVAARWGFSSPQHFATAFRRVLGIMPSAVLGRGNAPASPSSGRIPPSI